MLKLTKKEYEIEEEVVLEDDKGEELYKFTMKITPKEKAEIDKILLSEVDVNFAKKTSKLDKFSDEYFEELEKYENVKLEQQRRFEDICFKEHKEAFKEKADEERYLEMVSMLHSFFWKAFISKKEQQANTMITDLKKITKN